MTARPSRAQLVLTAAAVVAIALVPVTAAYLQLGYHADVEASAEDDPVADVTRYLGRVVHDTGTSVTGEYAWSERTAAVDAVRDALTPRLETLATARVAAGTVVEVTVDQQVAREHASEACPGGRGREFGPCEARRGVVVQERVGETHVLAVALDVRVVTRDGRHDLTLVVPVVA